MEEFIKKIEKSFILYFIIKNGSLVNLKIQKSPMINFMGGSH